MDEIRRLNIEIERLTRELEQAKQIIIKADAAFNEHNREDPYEEAARWLVQECYECKSKI